MNKKEKESCGVKEKITGFVDGELAAKERDFVARHLQTCAVCRKEHDALTSLDSLLRSSAAPAPSRDFNRNFWKKVNAVEQTKTPWAIFPDFLRGMRPALAAAASIAVIAAGSVIFYQADSNFLKPPAPVQNDMQFVENINLYRDFEIIANLELLEHWEEIVQLKEI